MMIFRSLLLGNILASSSSFTTNGFCTTRRAVVPGSQMIYKDFSLSSTKENEEVEALLRKARQLREEAQREEEEIHSNLSLKKSVMDKEMDDLISTLFHNVVDNERSLVSAQSLAHAIKDKHHFSVSKLEDIVTRLHEHEMEAKGLQHVEPSTEHHHDKQQNPFFEIVTSKADPQKVESFQNMINLLLEASEIIDTEANSMGSGPFAIFQKKENHAAENAHHKYGNLHNVLADKRNFLRREHEDQFKERLESYYDITARRVLHKKDSKKKKP